MFGENSMDCRFSTQAHDSRCVLFEVRNIGFGEKRNFFGFS